jgi:flagellar protein FlgJ
MNATGPGGQSATSPPGAGASKKPFNAVPENATPRQKNDLARLKKLSVDYESLFMKEVVSAMRKSVPPDGMTGGGNAGEIYKSMLDDHMAANMARQGNSGIAQSIYNKLSKTYLAVEAAKNGGAK